jgi:hypothetical protein
MGMTGMQRKKKGGGQSALEKKGEERVFMPFISHIPMPKTP